MRLNTLRFAHEDLFKSATKNGLDTNLLDRILEEIIQIEELVNSANRLDSMEDIKTATSLVLLIQTRLHELEDIGYSDCDTSLELVKMEYHIDRLSSYLDTLRSILTEGDSLKSPDFLEVIKK